MNPAANRPNMIAINNCSNRARGLCGWRMIRSKRTSCNNTHARTIQPSVTKMEKMASIATALNPPEPGNPSPPLTQLSPAHRSVMHALCFSICKQRRFDASEANFHKTPAQYSLLYAQYTENLRNPVYFWFKRCYYRLSPQGANADRSRRRRFYLAYG